MEFKVLYADGRGVEQVQERLRHQRGTSGHEAVQRLPGGVLLLRCLPEAALESAQRRMQG